MSVAILLVLPIFLSGYIYGRRAHHVKLKLIRKDGYHLYFSAATIGVLFIVFSTSLVVLLDTFPLKILQSIAIPIREAFNETFRLADNSKTHFAIVIIGLLSMLMAWILPCFINRKFSADECYRKSIEEDDFELLLIENAGHNSVSFSMENGKVYIGIVIRGVRPEEGERTHIRILPLRSGFRNKNSGLVKFTTYYWEVYEKLGYVPEDDNSDKSDEEFDKAIRDFFKKTVDFQVVLPAGDIKAAHIFDDEAFDIFEEVGESANQSN